MADATKAKIVIAGENQIGKAVTSASKDLNTLAKSAQSVGNMVTSALSVTAIIASFKQLASFMDDLAKQQAKYNQLATALGNDAKSVDKVKNAIEKLNYATTQSKDDLESIASELAAMGKGADEIEAVMTACVDLANVTGKDLNTAFSALISSYEGTTKALNKMGIETDGFTSEQLSAGAAVQAVIDKYDDLSKHVADTSVSQTIANISKTMQDIREAFGEQLLDTITPALEWLLGILIKIKSWAEDSLEKGNVLKEISNTGTQASRTFSGGAVWSFDYDLSNYTKEFLEEIANLATSRGTSKFDQIAEYIRQEIRAGNYYNPALGDKPTVTTWGSATTTTTSSTTTETDPLTAILSKYGNLSSLYSTTTLEGTIASIKALRDSITGTDENSLYQIKVLDQIITALNDQLNPTIDALATYIEGNGTKSLAYNLEQARAKAESAWAMLSGVDETDPAYTILKEIAESFQTDYNKLLTSSGYGYDATARAKAAENNAPAKADEAVSLIAQLGEVFQQYDIIQKAISLADPLTYLKEILGGIMEVLQPALEGIIMPIFKVLNTIGKVLGNILLPVLEPIAAIISWVCDWLGYLGDCLAVVIYNVTHPFNTKGFGDKPSSFNDHLTDITNSGYSTATNTAVSSASYQGGQTVTINIYQQSPVVGDNGMRAFASMIKTEFDALNYYGVGA